jgi:predicted Fe-Mo cluster-binding NifX family protein
MRIGMPMSRTDLDAPLAEHFGKARWLLVLDAPDRCEFVRNTELDGRNAARTLAEHGCTDVVALHLGPGAYAHVSAAGMRAWRGDPGLTARDLAERLARGALPPAEPGGMSHGGGGHGHHGRA